MTQTPQNKRVAPGAAIKTVAIVTVACLIAACNLDVAADWFAKDGHALEATYCYQVMTSIHGILGVDNWRACTAWSRLATCYWQLDRNHDAVYAAKRARLLMAKLTGDPSTNTCMLDAQVADAMSRAKKYAEAEKLLNSALADLDKLQAGDTPARAYVLSTMTKCLMQQKKFDEAEKFAKQLAPVDDALMKQGRDTSYGGRTKLAEIYCRTNKHDLATESALAQLKLACDLGTPLEQASAHDCLARVYLARGNDQSAKSEFDQAVQAVERHYGKGHEEVPYWRARYDSMLKDKKPFPD